MKTAEHQSECVSVISLPPTKLDTFQFKKISVTPAAGAQAKGKSLQPPLVREATIYMISDASGIARGC